MIQQIFPTRLSAAGGGGVQALLLEGAWTELHQIRKGQSSAFPKVPMHFILVINTSELTSYLVPFRSYRRLLFKFWT